MAKHPTGGRRNQRQKLKAKYAKAREEAQLHGLIDTTPEGALRPEQVDPAAQGEQPLPALDRRAVREDWSVPDPLKAKVIARLGEVFDDYGRQVVTKDGHVITVPPDRKQMTENAKVLIMADQRQYERDNPEAAGKAKGAGQTTITNNDNRTNVLVADLGEFFSKVDEQRRLRRLESDGDQGQQADAQEPAVRDGGGGAPAEGV